MRNDVLHRVKEGTNILRTITRRKAKWIGHNLRRNCLVQHVLGGEKEGRVGVKERRERRRKQLLADLKEKRGYWKFEEGTLRRSLWRIHFGLVRQTTKWMNTISVEVRLEGSCFCSGSVVAPNYAVVCCVVKPWWRFAYVLKIDFLLMFSCWACFSVHLSICKIRFTRILLDNFEPVLFSRNMKSWNCKSLVQVLGVMTLFSPHSSPFVISIGSRDSLVGIPNRYGLDGPVFEPRRGLNFPYPSRPALYSGYRICFPGLSGGCMLLSSHPP